MFLKTLINETVSNVLIFDLKNGKIENIEKTRFANQTLPIKVIDPFIRGYDRATEITPENFVKFIEKLKSIYRDVLAGRSSD